MSVSRGHGNLRVLIARLGVISPGLITTNIRPISVPTVAPD